MNLKESINHKTNDFSALCREYNVKKLYAFGSSIRDDFDERLSDIDLLIEMNTQDPIERGKNLMDFWDNLEQFFKRRVDLLTNSSVKNPILKKSIDDTKVLIYDGEKQEISI